MNRRLPKGTKLIFRSVCRASATSTSFQSLPMGISATCNLSLLSMRMLETGGALFQPIQVGHSRWDRVPLRADYGRGVETLLVATTEKAWKPNGEEFTMDSLIRQLDESAGVDNWRVGWVSYHIEPKKRE